MSPYMLKDGVIDYGMQIAVSHSGIKGRNKSGSANAWGDWKNILTF